MQGITNDNEVILQNFQTVYFILVVLYLSGRNKSGTNKNNESEGPFCETKEYVWSQNKDYVGGAKAPWSWTRRVFTN